MGDQEAQNPTRYTKVYGDSKIYGDFTGYGELQGNGRTALTLDMNAPAAMLAHLNEESLARLRQIVAEELVAANLELARVRQENEALRLLNLAFEEAVRAGVSLAGVSEQVGSYEQFADWRRWVLAWKGKAEGLLHE